MKQKIQKEENHIKYEYETLVPFVQNNDKTGMCPMENKFKDENDIHMIYNEMIKNGQSSFVANLHNLWHNINIHSKILF